MCLSTEVVPVTHLAGFTTSTVLDSAVFVNSTFGKRQQWDVDGDVHAQPLYAPGILVSGQPTNMLLVVTEHATLYALNAGASMLSRGEINPRWHDILRGSSSG